MKELKRSVKIIIIILLILICVLATVLGLVFGLKKNNHKPTNDPPNDPSNNPNSPVSPELQEQIILGSAINDALKDESYTINDFDNSGFVNPEGATFSRARISAIYDKGFIAKDDNNTSSKNFYIYRYESSKKSIVRLTDVLTQEIGFDSNVVVPNIDTRTFVYFDGYLAYKYLASSSNGSLWFMDIIYIENDGSITLVNRIKTEKNANGKYVYEGHEYAEFNVKYFKNYYQVEYYSEVTGNVTTTAMYEYYKYAKNINDLAHMFKVDLNQNSETIKYNYTYISKGLIIEKSEIVDVSNETSVFDDGVYLDYSYELFDFETGTSRKIELGDGISKLDFGSVGSSEYYYIISRAVDENNRLAQGGEIVYYDGNDKAILKYSARSTEDIIYYSSGKEVVTKLGIYGLTGNDVLETKLIFDQQNQVLVLREDLIADGIIVLEDSSKKLHFMNMKGEFIHQKGAGYDEIWKYDDKCYIAKIGNAYYLLDVISNVLSKFSSDFDVVNSITLFKYGMYMTMNSSNEYVLHRYDGKVVSDKIDAVGVYYNNGDSNMDISFIVLTHKDTDNDYFWLEGKISMYY